MPSRMPGRCVTLILLVRTELIAADKLKTTLNAHDKCPRPQFQPPTPQNTWCNPYATKRTVIRSDYACPKTPILFRWLRGPITTMFHRFVWAHFILTYEIVNQTVLSTYVFGPVYFLYKRRYYIYLFYCMASTERKGSVLKELKNKAWTGHLWRTFLKFLFRPIWPWPHHASV